MAVSRPDFAPVRRGLGAALVVFLLLCAVIYYRASPGLPTSASAVGTTSSAQSSEVSELSPSPSTTIPPFGDDSLSPTAEERTIRVEGQPATSAKPFEAVPIRGTYHGGADTVLQVQRREGTRWLTFPIPAKTDGSGRFSTHVELGQPGSYRLRVLDPDSGVTSEPFLLVIKG